MALLQAVPLDQTDSVCAINFELTSSETYIDGSWEGWLYYSISLRQSSSTIARLEGSIIVGDVYGFCENFLDPNKDSGEFEPLEPDFQLTTSEDTVGVLIACFVDTGRAHNEIYSSNSIGLRFYVEPLAAQQFAKEIIKDCERLTSGLTDISEW